MPQTKQLKQTFPSAKPKSNPISGSVVQVHLQVFWRALESAQHCFIWTATQRFQKPLCTEVEFGSQKMNSGKFEVQRSPDPWYIAYIADQLLPTSVRSAVSPTVTLFSLNQNPRQCKSHIIDKEQGKNLATEIEFCQSIVHQPRPTSSHNERHRILPW